MEFLSLCLRSVKRYFQGHQLSVFFFLAQKSQILLFSGMLLLERLKITVENDTFSKKICYGSLEFVFTLQERYFQGHQLSAFFHASDNSDSVVFVNAAFGEIRDHSL